jgi:4'-phosphopantetheinyl transferase
VSTPPLGREKNSFWAGYALGMLELNARTYCLEPGAVHVWYRLTEDLDEHDLVAALELLSPLERARYERFALERDRRDFAAAHGLLRSALSLYGDARPAEWMFDTTESGKPSLAGTGFRPQFNIAHTDGLVACAAAVDVNVGVDVESFGSTCVPNDVVNRCFSEHEIADLDVRKGIDRLERFTELWTLKEAYVKATGAGLSAPLNAFTFEFDATSGLRFHPPDGTLATEWQFALFAPSASHRMAVAVHSGLRSELRILTWSNGPADANLGVKRKSSTVR